MRKQFLALAAAGLMSAGLSQRAEAAPVGAPEGLRSAIHSLSLTETVGFYWGGRQFCWYDDGWNGPGWYWCGNYLTSGIGWGGGYGWHGWRGGHRGAFRGGRGVYVHGNRGAVGVRGPRGGGAVVVHGARGGAGVAFRGGGGHVGGGGRGGGGHRSDIRLKADIVPLERLDSGIGVYRFRYKGADHTSYVGVMAQEVQDIVPDAVSRDRDGYLRVNYDRLGLEFMTWKEWIARRGADSAQ
jgi:hypothetical protein